MSERAPKNRSLPASGLLGVGLDGKDGHSRVTHGKIKGGEDFLLVGGSEETHERLQDITIRLNEKLEARGKRYADLERDEFEELLGESLDD